ncbi:MAG: tyrosine--tRNA ligase [Rubricoccaceae bacterium]|nr:tyrosine--tRNA ligase [Rubricoccaceae bacterium]
MPALPPLEDQLRQIRRGVADILPEDALVEKLTRAVQANRPLTVKLGVDPTRPDLHLGHAVVLRKLRQFQDLGHRAVLIIGDFTAAIGDPSGKSKTRPPLSDDEIADYAETYIAQAEAVLDTDPERLRIVRNSEWLRPMAFADVIRLAGQTTVARMLERDDFSKRYAAGQPISLHEFLYPLAQAQDSVHLAADVELGGTDQTFNLLMGRALMEAAGQEPQVCLTLPILEGTDGVQKMSKSLDNYIGLTEAPEEMYGKTLSIPDALIGRYVELATDVPTEELPRWRAYAADDPRNAKHDLALAIVRMYHGEDAARAARAHFEKTVVQGDVPEDLPEIAPETGSGEVGLLELIRLAGFASSNSEARRLVQQGAVTLDGEKAEDPARIVRLDEAAPFVLKVGKRRYARVVRPS